MSSGKLKFENTNNFNQNLLKRTQKTFSTKETVPFQHVYQLHKMYHPSPKEIMVMKFET